MVRREEGEGSGAGGERGAKERIVDAWKAFINYRKGWKKLYGASGERAA